MRRANEIQLITETLKGRPVSEEELNDLQRKFLPGWTKYGIHLDLTDKHFIQQLNRDENRHNPVSFCELDALLEKFTMQYREFISSVDHNSYGVIQESNTLTNLVFFIDHNSRFEQKKDLRLITVMRKKDFSTSDQVYKIELT